MQFIKMHGCGNDYIYFDCMRGVPQVLDDSHISDVAIKLSDRHFSIGGDGVVLICASDIADAKMRMFNADGSEGKMCGNAIRCVGKFLYDNGYVKSDKLTVETLSGIKSLALHIEDGIAVGATVNMGLAEFAPDKIPMDVRSLDGKYEGADKIVAADIQVLGVDYKITAVSMGNPHCVIFTDVPVADIDLDRIGPIFENLPIFPQRVNTEFVNLLGDNVMRMRVWERGSGETLACGTGSCAVAAASAANGLSNVNEPIEINLVGGTLVINLQEDGVYMSGPAQIAYKGDVVL